jgi:hypothetical protein
MDPARNQVREGSKISQMKKSREISQFIFIVMMIALAGCSSVSAACDGL